MTKKKTETPDEIIDPVPEAPEAAPIEQVAVDIPKLMPYIRDADDTPRALATVRLDGGGAGCGTFLVDHPVPRVIANNAARYTLSTVEPDGTHVYIWVNP